MFMADQKQGQPTIPPQDQHQPNDPLPRSYNEVVVGTENPRKTSWAEVVGVSAEEAEKKIKEEMGGVEIQVVPYGSFVTTDFKSHRVRLYVDESNKVTKTPNIG